LIKKCQSENFCEGKIGLYELAFPMIFRNHPPVFAHGNFQRKNIIMRPKSIENDSILVYDMTIIDWEFSGWYPSYWEYSKAMYACGNWKDDWGLHVHKILDPFFNEYGWMHMFFTELWT